MDDALTHPPHADQGPFDAPGGAGAAGGGSPSPGQLASFSAPPPRAIDQLSDLAFFTRKDIMGMAFDAGIRFYQQIAIQDNKIKPLHTAPDNCDICLEHVVYNLANYLNDTRMGLAFAGAESKMNLSENCWELAITRERLMIAMASAGGTGP